MSDQPKEEAEKEARRLEIRSKRAASRKVIIEKLQDEGRDDLAQRLEKCGTKLRLKCTTCGTVKTVEVRCDNKWCPACAPLLAHQTVERFLPVAQLMLYPIYVTWTVKNWTEQVGLREFRNSFARLIKLRWFKRAVRGGVAAFELSRLTNAERKRRRLKPREGMGVHPHAHALMDCHWLSVTVPRPPNGTPKDAFKRRVRLSLGEVAAQWSLALRREGSVKVRATFHTDQGDPTRGLKETMKYSVSTETLENSDAPIAPLIDELILTRNLTTFGYFYKHPLLKKRKRGAQPCECGDCGTMMPASLVEYWERKLGKGGRR